MPRLFTALRVPAHVGLALSLKRYGLVGARWIDPDNYHITLSFIGDVDNRLAQDALWALEEVYCPDFALTIDGLGVFGGDRPRALYAGVTASEPLRLLHGAQERALRQVGLATDRRKFIPHVTLARLKGTSPAALARELEGAGHFAPLEFGAGEMVMLSSRANSGGGPYRIEQTYPLATEYRIPA